MLTDLARDLRYAARTLAQSPGFTAVAVLILALGIGANTTIFTLVDTLLFQPPRAVAAPQELVRLHPLMADGRPNWWSYPDYVFFRDALALDHGDALAGLAAFDPDATAVTAAAAAGGSVLRAEAIFVSVNYFDVLGVRPAAGRGFMSEEPDTPGANPEAVLSHGFWQRAFGARADAVGGVLRLNGHPFTVAGVAAAGFQGLSPVEAAPDVWVPASMQPVLSPSPADFLRRVENQTVTWLQVVGRLRPEVPLPVAQERLSAVNAALVEEFPAWGHEDQRMAVAQDTRFEPETRGRIVRYSRLLMGVVALVLATAGANVAILLLARTAARRRDLGVRLALGAGRGQIVRQLLAESLLLALAGAAGGFLLAFWSAGVAARALPFRFVVGFTPDLTVLAFAFAAAVATAVVFGLAPALGAARTDVLSVLKLGTTNEGRSWLRDGLVVAQVAVSIVLVGAAALFVRSLAAAESVDLGFESERRLLVSMNLRNHGYDEETGARFVEQALERLAPLPGVAGVSAAALVPFHGSWSSSFDAEGVQRADGDELQANFNAVGPGYFETLGIPLVDGRGFDGRDRPGAARVAVVSQAAAAMIWPDGTAVGRTLDLGDEEPTVVVGVARDAHYRQLAEDPLPFVYVPLLQDDPGRVSLIVRTRGAPMALARTVQDEIHELDPDVAFSRVWTMEEAVERLLGPFRVSARLVTLFASLALLLAAVGLYGVLAYLVVQRTRTIGIRMALGASARRVAAAVMARGLKLAAAGIVAGVAAALWAAGLVSSFLFEVAPRDPLSFAAVAAILAAVACAAGLLPAWRAARVDPIVALRDE